MRYNAGSIRTQKKTAMNVKMTSEPATGQKPESGGTIMPAVSCPSWYALYTRSRHEQSVAADLEKIEVERYLPIVTRERRWKDRRSKIDLPLFKGYVFVRCDLSGEAGWELKKAMLGVRSVVRLLADSSGVPAPIPDQEIFNLRTVLEQKMRVDPFEGQFRPGQAIRISKGPLAGVEGVLQHRKGATLLVLSVSLLNQAVSVTLSAEDVENMD